MADVELIPMPHGGALRPPQRKGDKSLNPKGINRWTRAREAALDQLVAVAEEIRGDDSAVTTTRMRAVWDALFLLAENGDTAAISLVMKAMVPDVDKLMAAALSNPGAPLRQAALPMDDDRRARLAAMGFDVALEMEEKRSNGPSGIDGGDDTGEAHRGGGDRG